MDDNVNTEDTAYLLSRGNEDLVYFEHDTLIGEDSDESAGKYDEYKITARRRYPTMSQGPWVEVEAGSIEDDRDKLGFTNENLHRRQDPKLSIKDESEVVPRNYTESIMGVHGYQTTKINTHVDYQDISKYNTEEYSTRRYDEDSSYYDEILRRQSKSEEEEIP